MLWIMVESRQAAALHANQISQLRGPFVHWHRWLLRARTLPPCLPLLKEAFTDPYTQTCTGSSGHPWFPPTHPRTSFHPSAGVQALRVLPLFSVCLGFSLVTVAVFALSRLLPSVLCPPAFCVSLFTATSRTRINLQDSTVAVRAMRSISRK